MSNRRRITFLIIAAAFVALSLPGLATAQGTYDPSHRDRDRDYRRDRDRDYRRNDDYYRRDTRYVRESIRRLKDLSRDLERDIDRALDHSRIDGTRREDRVNNIAREFQNAASDLKSSFGDGRNVNQSQDEARRVLSIASRLQRSLRQVSNDNRVRSDWDQVSRELRVISDFYGYRDAYYDNDDYRRNDDYGRDDRRRNDDERRRRIIDIFRRMPN